MWQNEPLFKYNNYLNNKHLIVSGKATRVVSGGRSEIPSPSYGATAPVMQNSHPSQMSKSRLPLKMVVSDVVHRDLGTLQQPSPTPPRFIVTPKRRGSPYDYDKNMVHRRSRALRNHPFVDEMQKKFNLIYGSSPYDYHKNMVHRRSHTLRNHPFVDEMQKKFNSIYGHHFQNVSSDTPCTTTSLAQESPMETDNIEQECTIPKFSNFYKEYLEKQQSVPEEMSNTDSHVYCNTDKYTLEENEIQTDESKKQLFMLSKNFLHTIEEKQPGCKEEVHTLSKYDKNEKQHFMLAKNFRHTTEENQPGCKEEADSLSKYSKNKSEDEYSSNSSQEYCSKNDNFCFSPLLEEKKDGFIPSRNKMISQTWIADRKCSAAGKIDVLSESPVSSTSEEDTDIWFADEDDEVDLN